MDGTFHATKAASRQSEASEPSEPHSQGNGAGGAPSVSTLPLTTSFPEESCFSRVSHRPHFQTLTTLSQANAALMRVTPHVVTLENLHPTIDVYQLLDTFDDFGTIAYAHGESQERNGSKTICFFLLLFFIVFVSAACVCMCRRRRRRRR